MRTTNHFVYWVNSILLWASVVVCVAIRQTHKSFITRLHVVLLFITHTLTVVQTIYKYLIRSRVIWTWVDFFFSFSILFLNEKKKWVGSNFGRNWFASKIIHSDFFCAEKNHETGPSENCMASHELRLDYFAFSGMVAIYCKIHRVAPNIFIAPLPHHLFIGWRKRKW